MGFAAAQPEASSEPQRVFTVGHSNWPFTDFIRLLKGAGIDLVLDVRSRPASGRNPQFTHPAFETLLREESIGYAFLGEELGGRPADADLYRQNGTVDYAACRKTYAFQAGIERVAAEAARHKVALVCAEEDPLDCHRFLMISPALAAAGLVPIHLRGNGELESQRAAEDRLLRATGFGDVANNTLFPEARIEALEKAMNIQAERAAFRVDPAGGPARMFHLRSFASTSVSLFGPKGCSITPSGLYPESRNA
jgi:uncharacterized protein DUF488